MNLWVVFFVIRDVRVKSDMDETSNEGFSTCLVMDRRHNTLTRFN